jgi:uncharacterized protein with GYD domain
MPAYVSLIDRTEQGGVGTVKGTPNRRGQAEALAQKHGVRFQQVYWTVGRYDVVVVLEAEDDEGATATVLELGARGATSSGRGRFAPTTARGDVGDHIGRLG